jgi:mRNA interferase RelE/StbE
MMWKVEFLNAAMIEMNSTDKTIRIMIAKGIKKVQQNPRSSAYGGYGKALKNFQNLNLAGFYKIKFLDY